MKCLFTSQVLVDARHAVQLLQTSPLCVRGFQHAGEMATTLGPLHAMHRIRPENSIHHHEDDLLVYEPWCFVPWHRMKGEPCALVLPLCEMYHSHSDAGTLDYLAPEMLTNPNTTLEEGLASTDDLEAEDILPYGSSVDVWAVGVIAYELVTGAAPFSRKGDTENDTMQRIMHWHDTEFPGSLSQQWAHFCRCDFCDMLTLQVSCAPVLGTQWKFLAFRVASA